MVKPPIAAGGPGPDRERVMQLLGGIPDPEIPVISIVELGIVRDVAFEGEAVIVTITPTYSGCPAMHAIEADVRALLGAEGYGRVELKTQLAPAWTTDWMPEAARARLREYGIAPPMGQAGSDTHRITLHGRSVPCVRCGSTHTERLSAFGSTACKALYRCLDCMEPFDYFKPI
jgi:ring-1,2-phenylacetyl-CoA epoxidase subunit PaaD